MNYEKAKSIKKILEAAVASHESILKQFPRGHMGLTADHVKSLPEFKEAKDGFKISFDNLRRFNSMFLKEFKSESLQERKSNAFR